MDGFNSFLIKLKKKIKTKKKINKEVKVRKKTNKYKYFKVILSGNPYTDRETFIVLTLNEAVEMYFSILNRSTHVTMRKKGTKKKHLLIEIKNENTHEFNNSFSNDQNEYIKSLEDYKDDHVKEVKDLSNTVVKLRFEEAFPYVKTTIA